MNDLLTLSVVLSIGIEAVKKTPLNRWLASWYQLLALVAGVALGWGLGFSPVEGFLAGASSMGLYDLTKFGVDRTRNMIK